MSHRNNPVRSHVDYAEYLERNIGIRVPLRKISDAVHRQIEMVVACELVDVPSGLESEMARLLPDGACSLGTQTFITPVFH